ncbi:hypothetical protein WICMUC_002553 [Wickerhamomyces mucosus]|uniref:Kinesin-like protein n=1 Tax=Wickerhamomyces mucosus TaxID=1378264 RepID=A0A9P8TEQ0_9ASCO|nr:hypothetical protein WICMUC_002553 [Wickerhamomyces mucosus]
MSSSADSEKIQVFVRCRGRNAKETSTKSAVVVQVNNDIGNEVVLNPSDELGVSAQLNSKIYQFDKVFGPITDQRAIFQGVASPLFDEFLKGYNCTLLVYGMTSSGKTYTMTGECSTLENEIQSIGDRSGIIPRVLVKLFDVLNDAGQKGDFIVKCSFLELYNEELKDLLAEDSNKKLRIFDQKNEASNSPTTPGNKSSIYIQNLEEVILKNADHGLRTLYKGLKLRQVAATKMNDVSSRSHTIFTITLFKQNHDTGELFRISKMNLVDLAGSENISRSGALYQRAKEAGSINQSLLTLGRVINLLVDKTQQHIPYRESKLTRLLQDSLGGRTKTCLIATISPARINYEETQSTLEYANKAKSIQNKPQIGSSVTKEFLVKELSSELSRVKADLQANRSKEGVFIDHDNYRDLMKDIQEYKTEIEESTRSHDIVRKQNDSLRAQLSAAENLVNDQLTVINTLNSTVEGLHNKIDLQKENEQNLMISSSKFKDIVNKMNQNLLTFKVYENQTKETVLDVIENSFHVMTEKILETIKTSSNNANVDEDLKKIEQSQHEMVSIFQEKIFQAHENAAKSVAITLPQSVSEFGSSFKALEDTLKSLIDDLNASFSNLSRENNEFKSAVNDNLFKNHDDILEAAILETNKKIEMDTNVILNQFVDILRDNNVKQQKLIHDEVNAMMSNIIHAERSHLDSARLKWDNLTRDTINICDSRIEKGRIEHNKEVKNLLTKWKDLSVSVFNSAKSQEDELKDISTIAKTFVNDKNIGSIGKTIRGKFSEINQMNSNLTDTLRSTKAGIESVGEKLGTDVLKTHGTSDIGSTKINEILDEIETEQTQIKKNLLPTGKTPRRVDSMKISSKLNNYNNFNVQKSPPKFHLIGQRFNSTNGEEKENSIGQSKRKASNESTIDNINKFQRVSNESRIPKRRFR